jgi:hypothetical protein
MPSPNQRANAGGSVPPAGWSPTSAHGFMRCNATQDGRLMTLSALMTWLINTCELPGKIAVDRVCTALEDGVVLYMLHKSDYAEPLPANHSFHYMPFRSLSEVDPEPPSEDIGLVGAIKHIRMYWGASGLPGETDQMGQHVLDPLAVRLDDAGQIFGYGLHVDAAASAEHVAVAHVETVPAVDTSGNLVTKPAPPPLTTGDIASAFDGLHWSQDQWGKPLGDKPKWLAACVSIPGRRGSIETRWNPVCIGGTLITQGHVQARSMRARFQTNQLLRPWLDEWKTYEADYLDTP